MKLHALSLFVLGLLAAACSSPDEPKNTPPIDAGSDREIVTDATPPNAPPNDGASQETSQPDTSDGPDAPVDGSNDAACVGTWDIGMESMAEQICNHQSNCKVCVQADDGHGNATTWSAVMDCPCPATQHLDAGSD